MSTKRINTIDSVCWRDATLTLKDDTNLVSRLWTPNKSGSWPALLMRQPYGREIASTVTYLHPAWWASHGYLVVIQDVRGQGGSSGSFSGFSQEALDTTETHKWVRALPECNGKLGTYGFSYQGLTQLVAKEGTPPPECMAPAMTGLSEKEHWSSDGGAFWWHIGLSWGLQLAALKARRIKDWQTWEILRRSLEDGSYLRDGPLLLEKYDCEGMVFDWLKRSKESQSNWKTHKALESWLKQPILLIGGWWDPHLKGILDLYKQSTLAGGNPEIHIGPASHLDWWEEVQQIHLDFFNRNLKDTPTKAPLKERHFLWNITNKQWQNSIHNYREGSYPAWGLVSNGRACMDSNDGQLISNSKGGGTEHLVHDPWRPVPAIGGHLSTSPGIKDRKSLDLRSDVATFTSPELTKAIHLEGIPSLQLIVEADQKGFDICVALSRINRTKDKVEQLSTGFLRVLGDQALQSQERKVTLQAILAEIQEGEQLRISIAGAAWPAIGINPGNDHQICKAPCPHCLVITMKIELFQSKLEILPLFSQKGLHDLRKPA